MSRIDEKSADQRAEEARLADRRAKELNQKQRTSEATAFDKAMARTSQAKTFEGARQAKGGAQDAREKAALHEGEASLLGEAEHDTEAAKTATQAQAGQAKGKTQEKKGDKLEKQARSFGEKLEEKGRPQPRAQLGAQAQAKGLFGQAQQASDKRVAQKADAEAMSHDGEAPDAKGEDISKAVAQGTSGTGGRRPAGAVDEGRDGGGQQKDQGGSDKDKAGNAFRLPPQALMAPPPLARPKDAGNARFRAITKEIVEKIVSRVLVGHNDKGIPEFRIDLKSSVMKGMSIKVSGGRGGKIRAVFSGSDQDTLQALKQSADGLKAALEARGLTVEELAFELADEK